MIQTEIFHKRIVNEVYCRVFRSIIGVERSLVYLRVCRTVLTSSSECHSHFGSEFEFIELVFRSWKERGEPWHENTVWNREQGRKGLCTRSFMDFKCTERRCWPVVFFVFSGFRKVITDQLLDWYYPRTESLAERPRESGARSTGILPKDNKSEGGSLPKRPYEKIKQKPTDQRWRQKKYP